MSTNTKDKIVDDSATQSETTPTMRYETALAVFGSAMREYHASLGETPVSYPRLQDEPIDVFVKRLRADYDCDMECLVPSLVDAGLTSQEVSRAMKWNDQRLPLYYELEYLRRGLRYESGCKLIDGSVVYAGPRMRKTSTSAKSSRDLTVFANYEDAWTWSVQSSYGLVGFTLPKTWTMPKDQVEPIRKDVEKLVLCGSACIKNKLAEFDLSPRDATIAKIASRLNDLYMTQKAKATKLSKATPATTTTQAQDPNKLAEGK